MLSHFINSLASPADDNARAGGMDSYRYLICLAVNLQKGDTSFAVFGLNSLPKLQVGMQKVCIVLISIPPCLPITYDANSKAHRVNFASH